jgi:energy-coupling factor transporter ATP-binding protein EcfA2
MRILKLQITDVKRITAAHIEPNGGMVVLTGKNGAGKTSVLDAIQMTLGGGDAIPPKPIREGATKGRVEMDLGDVVVTRTFTESGGGSLKIDAKVDETTRAAIKSPQTWLNERIGKLSFDPLAFMRQDAKSQGETLRRLVGLDTATLDAQRKAAYDERTILNRQVRDAEGALVTMPTYPDAPPAHVSAEDIQREIEKARVTNAEADKALRNAGTWSENVHRAQEEHTRALTEVTRLEGLLTEARNTVDSKATFLATCQSQCAAAEKAAQSMARIDEAPLLTRLTEVGTINLHVSANNAHADAAAKVETLRAQATDLTTGIDYIDSQKAQLLSAVPFPIEGLSFDADGGVTFRGLPLCQASGAEQVRVSMAVALAMNPKLQLVLIRDASLLDTESRALVAEMAEQADAQVWLEVVDDGDPGSILIEDGTVRERLEVAS